MVSSRPAALILGLALLGALFSSLGPAGGAGEAWAQQVSSARFVPTAPTAVPALPALQAPLATSQSFQPPGGAAVAPAVLGTQPSARTPGGALDPSTPGTSANPATPTNPANPANHRAGAGLAGRVLGNSSPLAAAGVYAYQLADLALYKVVTDPQGNFLFRDLPAGLYKIIANKPGFMPVVIMVTRTTTKAYQFLELQLAQRDARDAHDGIPGARRSGASRVSGHAADPADPEDFWALRARIPSDVLRDIEIAEAPESAGLGPGTGTGTGPDGGGGGSGQTPQRPEGTTAKAARLPGADGALPAGNAVSSAALLQGSDGSGRFHTEVQAMTGVANVAQVGAGQVSSGKLGIEGRLGPVQLGLSGRYWQMSSDSLLSGVSHSFPGASADGKTSAVSLDVQAGPGSRITVASLNNHLMPRIIGGPGEPRESREPVGLDHYQVNWSQALGENSHSDFAAQYTSESNYHRQSAIDPVGIPDASRTWRVEGSYTTGISENGSLQAGFRFSERQLGLVPLAATTPGSLATPSNAALAGGAAVTGGAGPALSPDHQTIDLFARGGTRLQPAFLVEYGLYSTLLDGSLSLTPQGGLVLQLGDGWQARGSASHRVYQQNATNLDFLPALFKESDLCEQGGKACYELNLSHHSGEDNSVSFSALERVVGQTLRLYFSDIVFDRLESLYLVPGDRLPELRFVVSHRISPQVRTSFESSLATGGGGTFIAADGRPYKNQVRYMVTSLDTRFLNTATGVFLAFHHLTQDLSPLGDPALPKPPGASAGATGVEFDRLQLMLSQDLNFLWNLAAQWALQVNMELSRGTAPYLASSDTQLHRRILGGINVKF
jgi:hypothetical protein